MRSKLLVAFVATAALAGCGGDDDSDTTAAKATPAAAETDLGPIKDYLLEHSSKLKADTETLFEDANAYYELAKSVDFDYEKLLAEHGDEVAEQIKAMQATFREANPAYEQMEGVVAGVPSLADFDVILDAGADKSDPENAVPFSVKTPAGKTFEQPGNFFFLLETSLWGTEDKFAAKGVTPDLDGDGKVEFGEALPDADFLVAAAKDFATNASDLDKAAKRVAAHRAGRLHRAGRDDADDVRVLRGVEELALRRRLQGRRRAASSPPRASRTSRTSSAASCSSTTASSPP